MERAERFGWPRGRGRAAIKRGERRVDGLPLRLSDVVISTFAGLAALYLVVAARWVPGWETAAIGYSIIAAGPPVLRALARRFPQRRSFDFLASFWLLPAVAFGHGLLSPIADALNPTLVDSKLAMADLRLFGQSPSVALAERLGPIATEYAMVCYYTYYLWPVLLGLILFFRGQRRVFDEYILALALFFAANFVLYIAVPAIGPRFYLAADYTRALNGLFFTPFLDSLMRTAAFTRDCFPSGHTGITLTVLAYAFIHRRRFFYVLLPIAAGLIVGTLVGRFHYGVDLLCAIPLTVAAVAAAQALMRARPQGVVVPRHVLTLREA